jgi:tryptophan synthase alpha chain
VTSRIDQTFSRLRERREAALIAYLMAGDPSLAETEQLVLELEGAGADIIELGVPFSDPIADGPVIQQAAERALRSGTSLRTILPMVKQLRTKTQIPLVLMAYYNNIHAFGPERFCREAVAAGIDGLIVPDLPPEESDELLRALEPTGVDPIFLVAPTSTDERLRAVAARARGFIYCVSLTGVTGARAALSETLPEYLGRVRRVTEVPLAVGFGVSRPEHIAALRGHADAAIVASAILDLMAACPADEQPERLRAYAARLRQAAGPRPML